jgi:hypothetical protein
MLNNIYKKKNLRSPGKYRSNTFLENLAKNKKIDNGKTKKNFIVDSGGNDQLSPHMFNYGSGRINLGQSSNNKNHDLDRSGNGFRDRNIESRNNKNFTQEQFMSHNPNRKAGLSLNRSKYTSPLIPSLNKNFMMDNEMGFQGSNNSKGRGFHHKNPSHNKLSNLDLKLQKKNLFFNPEMSDRQFLSSRATKNDISKRGSLFDKTDFQRFKKGNTIVGSFNMKGNQKLNSFTKDIQMKKKGLADTYH